MNNALQQTEDWFEARKGKVTASRAGAILGLSKYATPEDVMREMVREVHGAEREFTGNVATQWGIDHEPEALKWLENEIGELVVSTGFHVHPKHDWLGASPDGLVGTDTFVEVKCPYNRQLFRVMDRPDYMAQTAVQSFVTGRVCCIFVVWTPEQQKLYSHAQKLQNHHFIQLEDFYQSFCDISGSDKLSKPYLEDKIQIISDDDWIESAGRLKYLKTEADEIAKQMAEEKERLIKLANGRKSRGAGVMVYPVKGRSTVDYKKAIAELAPGADLSGFTKQGKESWSVRVG